MVAAVSPRPTTRPKFCPDTDDLVGASLEYSHWENGIRGGTLSAYDGMSIAEAFAAGAEWHQTRAERAAVAPPTSPQIGRCATCGLEDRHYYEDILARVKAFERAAPPTWAPDWQPIETAPKDGTWFVAMLEGWDHPGMCRWFERGVNERGFWGYGGMEQLPTHWLPIPPQADKETK